MHKDGFLARMLRGDLPIAPITKHLGWKFLDFDPETHSIKVEMTARPEFANPAGNVHGGMIAAMLDETLAPAAATTLEPNEFAPTIEMTVNFMTSARIGSVLGTARVVSKSRSICFLEGRLEQHGKLIATASGIAKVTKRTI